MIPNRAKDGFLARLWRAWSALAYRLDATPEDRIGSRLTAIEARLDKLEEARPG